MAVADFLAKKMIGKELCVHMGKDAETVTYDQSWTANHEYFRGIVRSVEEGILELDIVGQGTLWINCKSIESFWLPSFNYHQALRATITNWPTGGRKKPNE